MIVHFAIYYISTDNLNIQSSNRLPCSQERGKLLGYPHTLFKRKSDHFAFSQPSQAGTSQITSIKKLALRRGTWYRALSRVERGILDLTVRYVENIKSAKLATLVTAILQKLALASESLLDRLVRTVGLPLAQKISAVAQGWGNISANKWAVDTSFAQYLAVMERNR